jgi:hypothetical protein
MKTLRNKGETDDDFHSRCWRHRAHTNKNGEIFIPPQAWLNSFITASQHLGLKIPGKGKATYTKYFKSSVRCYEQAVVGHIDDAFSVPVFGNSQGRKQGTEIFADEITKEVFWQVLLYACNKVGIGTGRPESGFGNGIYEVVAWAWEESLESSELPPFPDELDLAA